MNDFITTLLVTQAVGMRAPLSRQRLVLRTAHLVDTTKGLLARGDRLR
jgi:hypothetical protein